ncbi:hypothetical protein PACTADRAFT_2100 [Pachysolen tannophilus NRRL Y-2460]|uniref:NADH:ubiquinone oxidoreductase intermediate-associated protein 30 domain-containing protein n=1 Tax=Pachysolen tannophilus NRRL Y-2460 TaxID=669874 RepID=A0A1E4TVN6_PACTA|nr:hypothetical protein PACTADRAFT_2100 [Pachysolen tannophilus NRRL Y-2460]
MFKNRLLSIFKDGLKSTFSPPVMKNTMTVLDFTKPYELSQIITRCDQELGGYSTCFMEIDRVQNKPLTCAHFHGILNLDTPKKNPKVLHSGWAMFRTKHKNNYQHKLFYLTDYFGNYKWDFSFYHSLVLRVKGDNRKYFLNIQTDNPSRTDLFQHRIFLNNPGKWETVIIPLDDFVLTNRGRLANQYQSEMERERIKSIGIGITDGQYGPYSLYIENIKVLCDSDLWETIRNTRSENNQPIDDVKSIEDAKS